MTPSIPYFLSVVALVSISAGIFSALTAARIQAPTELTQFGTGILGVILCAGLAYAAFFVLDPDPVSEFDDPVPRHLRTLPITGFSAIIWLPIYMSLFIKLHRRHAAT